MGRVARARGLPRARPCRRPLADRQPHHHHPCRPRRASRRSEKDTQVGIGATGADATRASARGRRRWGIRAPGRPLAASPVRDDPGRVWEREGRSGYANAEKSHPRPASLLSEQTPKWECRTHLSACSASLALYTRSVRDMPERSSGTFIRLIVSDSAGGVRDPGGARSFCDFHCRWPEAPPGATRRGLESPAVLGAPTTSFSRDRTGKQSDEFCSNRC